MKNKKPLTEEQKQAKKEYLKNWQEKNKEKIKLQRKEYYENNKEIIKQKTKDWVTKNPERKKEQDKLYRKNNPDKRIGEGKRYREKNSEKKKISQKEYREKNLEKITTKNKKWLADNPNYYNNYVKNRKKIDPLFKLNLGIRTMIYQVIKKQSSTKKSKTQEILGCTIEEFKSYLESKFEPWMRWENHGLYNGELNFGWDIDHIIPLSSASNEIELLGLCHYTNLQPLCSYTNRYIKKNNILN